MGETPDLSHMTSKDYDSVYEPAEDTFLFMDALLADVDTLKRLRWVEIEKLFKITSGQFSHASSWFDIHIKILDFRYLCQVRLIFTFRCWIVGMESQRSNTYLKIYIF